MAKFDIGTNFSHDPSGRYYADGDASGENFRENYLLTSIRALKENEKLTLILDNDVDTYGSSFLNESFGGLVRFGYIEPDKLLDILLFEYSDKDYAFYEDRIKAYIQEAKYKSQVYTPSTER